MVEKQELVAAVTRLAGTARVLIYDVPEEGAPERPSAASPFIRGSKAWWEFVERRRLVDDGQDLTLLVSLRGLRLDERMIVVNWGTAYANAFLLVEPTDPWLDLTVPDGIASLEKSNPRAADVNSLVRSAYAEWIYWYTNAHGETESRRATLNLADPESTLWSTLWERLPKTFSASAYLSSLTLLNMREAELFTGGREVARAVVPFLTRLGLPILYDARHVISGVRELVNVGLAWVQDPEDNWRTYRGPAEPIPAEITDERLAMMVR